MKKFVHFNHASDFAKKKVSASANNQTYTLGGEGSVISGTPDIKYSQIVFIKDSGSIYTHGAWYRTNIDVTELLDNGVIDIPFDVIIGSHVYCKGGDSIIPLAVEKFSHGVYLVQTNAPEMMPNDFEHVSVTKTYYPIMPDEGQTMCNMQSVKTVVLGLSEYEFNDKLNNNIDNITDEGKEVIKGIANEYNPFSIVDGQICITYNKD